jgi:hypothetical protein
LAICVGFTSVWFAYAAAAAPRAAFAKGCTRLD